MTRRLLIALVAVSVAGLQLSAQQQPADPNAPVSFEAASIKPTTTSDGNSFVRRMPGGRFDAHNVATGLTGNWDFELMFTPERPLGVLPPGVELPPVDPNAPTIFTAVQERLGLKLDSTKGPVEVWVIDSIEKPMAD